MATVTAMTTAPKKLKIANCTTDMGCSKSATVVDAKKITGSGAYTHVESAVALHGFMTVSAGHATLEHGLHIDWLSL